jgi:hypothetical protein
VERLYRRVARARIVGLSLLLTVLAFVAFASFDKARPTGTPGVVALELAFSAETFSDIITQWGAEGVRAYQVSTLCIDYWFPVAYAVFLAGLIAVLTVKPGGTPSGLQLTCFALPFIAGLLDWVENAFHLILLRDPSHVSAPLVLLASIAAAAKWGLIVFSILAILYITVSNIRVRLTKTSDHTN